MLLASNERVRECVTATYSFDEPVIEPSRCATSVVEVTATDGEWRGTGFGCAGACRPALPVRLLVDPRRPSVTSVVTTIERPA